MTLRYVGDWLIHDNYPTGGDVIYPFAEGSVVEYKANCFLYKDVNFTGTFPIAPRLYGIN